MHVHVPPPHLPQVPERGLAHPQFAGQTGEGPAGFGAQAQERALSESLDKRLSMVADRLTEGLSKSSKEAQATMGELGKRLAVIDAAQSQLSAVSSYPVSYQLSTSYVAQTRSVNGSAMDLGAVEK